MRRYAFTVVIYLVMAAIVGFTIGYLTGVAR